MTHRIMRRRLLGASAGLLLALSVAGAAEAQVTLTYLVDDNPTNQATADALKAAFEAENPDIKIDIETRPGGGEGDNIIKTRLATGEMTDVFRYNAGSLFQALNPSQTMLDLTDEPWQGGRPRLVQAGGHRPRRAHLRRSRRSLDGWRHPLQQGDLRGAWPVRSQTWDEFMANNQKIKDAGKVAVIQTFGDTWTSQLFVLGDFFNVQAANPDFAADYTAGKAKYATTPAAVAGFQHGQDVFEAGFLNEDFAAATFNDGVRMVATGEGAHYPMLTFAIGGIAQDYPENLDDVGFFAIPGPDASSKA